MFRLLLVLPDGQPNDPALVVTAVANWSVEEEIVLGDGERLRVVGIADQIADELVAHGISGVLTVEPTKER